MVNNTIYDLGISLLKFYREDLVISNIYKMFAFNLGNFILETLL